MVSIGRNMQLFFAIKHLSKSIVVFITDIYLTISLYTVFIVPTGILWLP